MTLSGMHYVRRGSGRPLLLIHGLGSSWRSWNPVLPMLESERELIAVDLPGFGSPLAGEVSIATLADALERFLAGHDLDGADVVGSSMGARLALELSAPPAGRAPPTRSRDRHLPTMIRSRA